MHKHHPPPHLYVASTLLTVVLAVVGFDHFGYHDRYFFVPIFALSVFWSLIMLTRPRDEMSDFHVDRKSPVTVLLKRALLRYLVWLIVFYLALSFFETHTFYRTYAKTIEFLQAWFDLYLIVGFPYFVVTLKYRASRTEDFYDPAVRLLLLAKHALAYVAGDQKRGPNPWKRKYNRKVLLNLFMRAYFMPVMTVQVYDGLRDVVAYQGTSFSALDLLAILSWITALLWLADSLSASTGYCLETRWSENRSRSVDLTAGGWLICLCCYPPLNMVTGAIFPFAPTVVTGNAQDLLIASTTLLIVLKCIEVVLLSALVYCDLSLGPSGVNITFKKLQSRGPYGIVRHPATTCKLTFWWAQSLLYVQFWSWEFIVGQMMWNVVYILRALSEERHLRQFPEYRAYMERVRYRFIPGVI